MKDLIFLQNTSWTAAHTSKQPGRWSLSAITVMLPLFPDNNCKDKSQNESHQGRSSDSKPKPSPSDQCRPASPCYCHREDNLIIILRELHIEISALNMLGVWLEDSGWVEAVVQSKIASAGTADSFLKVSHVTRTGHVHQVTATTLHILAKRACTRFVELQEPGNHTKSLNDWCTQKCQKISQLQFWYSTLLLELVILSNVRSLGEGNFELYIDFMTHLALCTFLLIAQIMTGG